MQSYMKPRIIIADDYEAPPARSVEQLPDMVVPHPAMPGKAMIFRHVPYGGAGLIPNTLTGEDHIIVSVGDPETGQGMMLVMDAAEATRLGNSLLQMASPEGLAMIKRRIALADAGDE